MVNLVTGVVLGAAVLAAVGLPAAHAGVAQAVQLAVDLKITM